jgi:HK97 gp10 family phage protein
MARGVKAGRRSFSIDGILEANTALRELPKATQGTVMLRALKRIAKPIRDAARANAPVRTGRLKRSIEVVALKQNDVGKKEFHATMKAGGTTEQAVAAMRDARRRAKGRGTAIEVAITTGKMAHAIFQEYGTAHHEAHAFMRPAWDRYKGSSKRDIQKAVEIEIEIARKRLAASAERRAAKMKAKG